MLTTKSCASGEAEASTPRASLTSLGDRLSRISCGTKHAIALNQIDRIRIHDAYERDDDGVTMYVLDVYVQCVQTGIPTASRQCTSASSSKTEVEDSKDPLLRRREQDGRPHYRLAYSFSDFYKLRKELQQVTELAKDPLHLKWCKFCCRLDWLVHSAPFPARSVIDAAVTRVPWIKRWRIRRRKHKLADFLSKIIHGARAMQYRFSDDQCDGFVNTAYILREFLSEPQMRLSSTVW